MVEALDGIAQVVIQDTIMYNHIVKNLRPDYIVHGSNWDDPGMNVIKDNIVSCLKEYGGKLIEIPYTYNNCGRRRSY